MNKMTTKRKLDETPYGKITTGVSKRNGCAAWQRAFCLEIRIDNEPESLLVEGRTDILQCKVCGHIIDLEEGK